MSTDTDGIEHYAHLWRESPPHTRQWVIWNTAAETMVFDREINCPVDIEGGAVLRAVLRRMRAAGVPESDDYPGRPCA